MKVVAEARMAGDVLTTSETYFSDDPEIMAVAFEDYLIRHDVAYSKTGNSFLISFPTLSRMVHFDIKPDNQDNIRAPDLSNPNFSFDDYFDRVMKVGVYYIQT